MVQRIINSHCHKSKRWEESRNWVKSAFTISRARRMVLPHFMMSSHFQISKDFITVQRRNGWPGRCGPNPGSRLAADSHPNSHERPKRPSALHHGFANSTHQLSSSHADPETKPQELYKSRSLIGNRHRAGNTRYNQLLAASAPKSNSSSSSE